jgi:hypothetical protein
MATNDNNFEKHPVHPATLPIDELLEGCEFERTKRGGPGGQHRNKTESAIVVTHRSTGVTGQASERRSQHRNRAEAIERLRLNLALAIRVSRVDQNATSTDGESAGEAGDTNEDLASENQASESLEKKPDFRPPVSQLWKSRVRGGKIQVSQQHEDFAGLLAEALDWMAVFEFEIPSPANQLGVSNSQLVKFFKSFRPAWELVQRQRESRGLHRLK